MRLVTTTLWAIGVDRSVYDELDDRLREIDGGLELVRDWFPESSSAREQLASGGPNGPLIVVAAYDEDDAWSLRVVLSQITADASAELREVLILGEGPMSRFPVLLTDHPALRLIDADESAMDRLVSRIEVLASQQTWHQAEGIVS